MTKTSVVPLYILLFRECVVNLADDMNQRSIHTSLYIHATHAIR